MKNERIGLLIGTDRGLAVLEGLLKAGRKVCGALVLEQQSHEINDCTGKIIHVCMEHDIPVLSSSKVKPADYQSYLEEMKPDVVFVVSWRFLIRPSCFSIPQKGMFVLHDSLLPKYRGFAPTNWVILNGEKQTGLSLQYISEGMDEGDLVDQVPISIDERETATSLNAKFLEVYPQIILKNLDAILAGTSARIPQDHSNATFGCKRSPENGKLNFSRPTEELDRLIRALSWPYPGAFCDYGEKRVIIREAEPVEAAPVFAGRIPGRIWKTGKEGVEVLTGDGLLRIRWIGIEQDGEEKIVPAGEVLNKISVMLT